MIDLEANSRVLTAANASATKYVVNVYTNFYGPQRLIERASSC